MIRIRPGTLCFYCGALATSPDHVPAQSIYQQPVPKTAPWVPACAKCNSSFSSDDEYFRDTIVKSASVGDLPQAAAQVQAMLRAAGKPKKRRYAERQLRAFRNVAINTPAGLYLGHQPVFLVDNGRIARTLRRYVEGLYFWETKARLSPPNEFTVQPDPGAVIRDWPRIRALVGDSRPVVVQPSVFGYRWLRASDNPDAMVWLLVFFEALPFLAISADKDRFETFQRQEER